MKRWEWGVRNRDRDRGRDWESGAVGGQQAAIWSISVKMNVYKRSCEKMVIIFSQLFFIYFISW
mgnify:CR=1 FL=1